MAKINIGNSAIELSAPKELINSIIENDKPFDKNLARGEKKIIALKFGVDNSTNFNIGDSSSVKLDYGLEANTYLDIIWPKDDDHSLLKEHDLFINKDGKIEFPNEDDMVIIFDGNGKINLGASSGNLLSTGPFKAAIGISAGGEAGYKYFKTYKQSEAASTIVQDFFKSFRLPSQIKSKDDIPSEGEIIILEYGGYLNLSTAISYGLSVSKSNSFKISEVDLKSLVDITAGAKMAMDYKIAGNYGIEVRKGELDDWIRVIYRKKKTSRFDFALDVGAKANLKTDGWPKDADAFLEAALGIRMPQIVEDINSVLEKGSEKFLEELKDKADGVLAVLVDDLFKKHWPGEIIETSYSKVYEYLDKVTDKYNLIRNADQKLVDLIESYIGSHKEVDSILDILVDISGSNELKKITDSEIWGFIEEYDDSAVLNFVTDENAFLKFKLKLAELKNKGLAEVIDFIKAKVESLGLSDIIEDLKRVSTPDEFLTETKKGTKAIVEKITNKAFEKIKDETSELENTFEDIKELVENIEQFKNDVYKKLQDNLNNSFELELSKAYSYAKENEKLFDVEINLNSDSGEALLEDTLRGNLKLAQPKGRNIIKINSCVFKKVETATSTFKINLFGYDYREFKSFVSTTEEEIRQTGNGLLHIYNFTNRDEVERIRGDEETKLACLWELTASSLKEDKPENEKPDVNKTKVEKSAVTDTVNRMAVSYKFDIKDKDTTEEELYDYLELAQHLNLFEKYNNSMGSFIIWLKSQSPNFEENGFGEIEVSFNVGYKTNSVIKIFDLTESKMKEIIKNTFRKIIAANYEEFKFGSNAIPKVIWNENLDLKTFKSGSVRVEDLKGNEMLLSELEKYVLDILFKKLEKIIKTCLELKNTVHIKIENNTKVYIIKNNNKDKLKHCFKKFSKSRNDLEKWVTVSSEQKFVNPIFIILDALIEKNSSDYKSSVMKLKYKINGEVITKILTNNS